MGLFGKSKSCPACKTNLGRRFCLRRGGQICWSCCNQMRSGFKCPENCRWHLRPGVDMKAGQAVVESNTEHNDLTQRLMDAWLIAPQADMDGQIPIIMAESSAGLARLEEYTAGLATLPGLPVNYLRKRLHLKPLLEKILPGPEDTAGKIMQAVMAGSWGEIIPWLVHSKQYNDPQLRDSLIKRWQEQKNLRRVDSCFLVATAREQHNALYLCHYELNHKLDLCLQLIGREQEFYLVGMYWGTPLDYRLEADLLKQVAPLLAQGRVAPARPLLKQVSERFFTSADSYYYHGLAAMLDKNPKQAEQYFFTAWEIDPGFNEALFNLAFVQAQTDHTDKAVANYRRLCGQSDDPRVYNNLAYLLEQQGQRDEAVSLWKRCLELDPEFSFAKANLERLDSL